MLQRHGIGVEVAGQLLVAAGDNPDRLRSEGAFAMLCGVSPPRPPPARPNDTGSTEVRTGKPTAPCLKRYLAREVYCLLNPGQPHRARQPRKITKAA